MHTIRAFTLIELLVVITIIVVLLSLLTPALDRAILAAEETVCLTNERAAGQAISSYVFEHRRVYPQCYSWGGLYGKRGASDVYPYEVEQRPLNEYLGYTGNGGEVPVAECPLDRGDAAEGQANMYQAYGTSYLPMAQLSFSRLQLVFGYIPDNNINSMTLNQIRRTSNKVLLMDWPSYGNRSWDNTQTRWHDRGDYDAADDPFDTYRYFNVLFADGHAERFGFLRSEIETAYGWDYEPPSPSFKWW